MPALPDLSALYNREAVTRLAALAREAAERLTLIVAESGGCDHSAGICFCPEIKLVSDVRAALPTVE